MVYCSGLPNQLNTNSAGQFEVVQSQYSAAAIKLRNLAYPQFYLAIVNGYFIGNVSRDMPLGTDHRFEGQ